MSSSSPDSSILKEICRLCGDHGDVDITSTHAAKSAQQEVWILEMTQHQQPSELSSVTTTTTSLEDKNLLWQDCLRRGSNRLVLRIWKGGCQWWNLNRNQNVENVADAEIAGYRLAHQSMQQNFVSNKIDVIIPQVLYYSKSCSTTKNKNKNNQKCNPWAVLEYVGPESKYFDNGTHQFDSTYLNGMVICRREFGFDEPHPRWGRVPENQALTYAMMVLHQVILPLHRQSRQILSKNKVGKSQGCADSTQTRTYAGLVKMYQEAWRDMAVAYQDSNMDDERMNTALTRLETAVTAILPGEACQGIVNNLSPVLVHLDLQPQNLLFARSISNDDDDDSDDNNSTNCKIRSVLDWEDAALADPRFELLLLGRKVCANREQAETIWKEYAMMETTTTTTTTTTEISSLGPLKPWLQLETIHSITTLLLQSMDLLNGGRNPWETMADLWDKLQREFARWEGLCAEEKG